MTGFTCIGDVHGKVSRYKKIINKLDYSVQLGDFGFDYSILDKVNKNHVFLSGNHDNYDILESYPPKNYLGKYGEYELNGIKFFFISGGYSIDDAYRRNDFINGGPKTWWHQEELNFADMEKCKELYLKSKPDILLTHSPSRKIISNMTNSKTVVGFGFDKNFYCQTSSFYDNLIENHTPKVHIFGHMHRSYKFQYNGCLFICLAELETLFVNRETLCDLRKKKGL